MRGTFDIAGGTVAGFDHVRAGRNNQDAFAWHQDDDCTIAVVCDGCSEGAHSEVGAQLTAQLLIATFRQCIADPIVFDPHARRVDGWRAEFPRDLDLWLYGVRCDVLRHLEQALRPLGGTSDRAYKRAIASHALATAVCAIVAPWGTIVCSIGDGYWVLDGLGARIGPFPKNEPPYLAYDLLAAIGAYPVKPDPPFTVHAFVPTDEVATILIGTDGVCDLVAAADRALPGRPDEHVGSLAQFWEDARYIRNPDMVRRRLTRIGREHVAVEQGALVRTPGLLHDDTTLVVIRRR